MKTYPNVIIYNTLIINKNAKNDVICKYSTCRYLINVHQVNII